MKKLVTTLIILFAFSAIYAQSSEVITDILNSDKITFGQACYISAVQQKYIEETASYTDAIEALYKKGQIPTIVYEDTVLPLVDLAYIYAQMWGIKGGLFYRLFNGAPRYAFKQLKADGVIPPNADPHTYVTGAEALNIYTACVTEYDRMKLYID